MPLTSKNEDIAGAALIKVQDDLRRLKRDLVKLTDTKLGKALNFQELETAIRNTESDIKKRADECLRTKNHRLQVYPKIDTLQNRTLIPVWDPGLECLPISRPARPFLEEKPKHWSPPDPVVNIQSSQHTGAGHKGGLQKAASLNFGHDLQGSKKGLSENVKSWEFRYPRPPQCEPEPILEESPGPSIRTPPPTVSSKTTEYRNISHNTQNLSLEVPEKARKLTFTIKLGLIEPTEDFSVFMKSCSPCWSSVEPALGRLCQLLQAYAVPRAEVEAERLLEVAHSWDPEPPVSSLLSVLLNREDVLEVLSRPGQRFRGEGGKEAAAVLIQSCWRRRSVRSAYLRRRWAVRTISGSWMRHVQRRRVRKALQARRFSQLENQRQRIQHLASDWSRAGASRRTIIHVPSLGYSQSERRSLRNFDVLQNIQMGRLCEIRDENVDVIYVCPLHLDEDVLQYYSSLLKCNRTQEDGTAETSEDTLSRRPFVILTPEAVDRFPNHSLCLSSLLKYSPRTLQRIRRLIQGTQAFMVPGVTHTDDLAVADALDVPLLGPELGVAQLYSTRSGARTILREAAVQMAPGAEHIYSLEQLHESLAELLVQNLEVKRWLFKMDSERGGSAQCDVRLLKCHPWALSQYLRHGPEAWSSKAIQEPVLLRLLQEVPLWLSSHARPAQTSQYSTWACFLHSFLRQGGVVEACPPSDLLSSVTVDLLLEPGGHVSLLSSGDQLLSPCGLQVLGSSVPQRSVSPQTLHSLCTRVGQACLRKNIVGHISVHLVSFSHCTTKQHTVWALDLNLSYSDHLAMTHMLLHSTQGTLCWQNALQVPMPTTEDSPQKFVMKQRSAVLSSSLYHASLSMLYRRVFFQMCQVHGIGFNAQKKQGTLFALFDSKERQRIGMIAVSEGPEGALATFARNLSVVHQEISSSRTQGETNFKELIKEIEEFLQKSKRRGVVRNTSDLHCPALSRTAPGS